MSIKTDIEGFLKDFKTKMNFWNVLFRDERGKNTQALIDLEIRPVERINILKSLEYKDYCEGPIKEKLYGGVDMWVFGKMVKTMKFISKSLWEQ